MFALNVPKWPRGLRKWTTESVNCQACHETLSPYLNSLTPSRLKRQRVHARLESDTGWSTPVKPTALCEWFQNLHKSCNTASFPLHYPPALFTGFPILALYRPSCLADITFYYRPMWRYVPRYYNAVLKLCSITICKQFICGFYMQNLSCTLKCDPHCNATPGYRKKIKASNLQMVNHTMQF